MGNILEVVNMVDDRLDKNNDPYHLIELRPEKYKFITSSDGRKVKVRNLDTGITITAWTKRTINGSTFKHMAEFDLKKGDLIEGKVVRRQVEAYNIDGNIVTTYSCFVAGDDQDTASWNAAVKATFAAREHTIIEEGQPAVFTPEMPEDNREQIADVQAEKAEVKKTADTL